MTDHPITPPSREQVGKWLCEDGYPWDPNLQATITITTGRLQNVATQAARWGADQEFEACCSEILAIAGVFGDRVDDWSSVVELLRDGRRPGLRERAIQAVDRAVFSDPEDKNLIICALERLND